MDRFVRARLACVCALAAALVAVVPAQPARASRTAAGHAGSLDGSFGYGGRVRKRTGLGADAAHAVVALPRGGLLIASSAVGERAAERSGVTKLRADGSFDETFGRRGRSMLGTRYQQVGGTPVGMVVLPDGRIVVLTTSNDGSALYRILADGEPDPSFDGDGRVDIVVPGHIDAYSPHTFEATGLALAPNGDLVVVGIEYPSIFPGWADLVRYRSDGALRTQFGDGGIAPAAIAGGVWLSGNPIIDTTGRIVVPGTAGSQGAALLGYTPFGAPDPTFGAAGVAAAPVLGELHAATFDGTQRIVAAGDDGGSLELNPIVVRFDALGIPDASFGGDGVADIGRVAQEERLRSVAVNDDGTVMVAGSAGQYYEQIPDALTIRLLPSGDLDPAYGTSGRATTPLTNGFAAATVQGGNLIGVGGLGGDTVVARVDDHGALAAPLRRFNVGFRETDVPSALAVAPDGGIIFAGASGDTMFVGRLHPNGAYDRRFGDAGVAELFDQDRFHSPTPIALDHEGRIYIAFTGYYIGGPTHALVRLLPDGSVDRSFGADGFIDQPVDVYAGVVLVDAADRPILVSGFSPAVGSGSMRVQRFTTQGALDMTYGDGGTATFSGVGASGAAFMPDGGVVTAGGGPAENPIGLERLTADGQLQPGFTPVTNVGVGDATPLLRASGVAVEPDGGIVVAGSNSLDGSAGGGVARFLSNGLPDPTFDGGGVRRIGTLFFMPIGPLVQPDGKILLASERADGTGDLLVARVLPDGSFDPDFGTDGRADTNAPSGGTDELTDIDLPFAIAFHQGQLLVAGNSFFEGVGLDQFLLQDQPAQGLVCTATGPGVTTWFGARTPDGVRALGPLPTPNANAALGADIAAGDLAGDGHDEIVLGSGPGQPASVDVYAASTRVTQFAAFDAAQPGGARVAVGDLDGDGRAEIVVGAGPGAPPLVRVFDAAGALRTQFLAFESGFRGGVDVAVVDTGDDLDPMRIVVGPGAGRPAVVRTFDRFGQQRGRDLVAFGSGYRGGIHVAALRRNDDSDSGDAIVVGAGSGGYAVARVLGLPMFTAFGGGVRGGVDVSGVRLADGRFGIAVAAGPGMAPTVRVVDPAGADVAAGFSVGAPTRLGGTNVAGCASLSS